jgi:hypothetical protein
MLRKKRKMNCWKKTSWSYLKMMSWINLTMKKKMRLNGYYLRTMN